MADIQRRDDVNQQARSVSAARVATGAPTPQGKRTGIRWWIIFLCFLATTINYIDRTNLSVAAPFIGKELNINSALMGLILSAFFWTYAVFQLPSGWFVDRLGPRISYTFACIW
jgi:MFS family permease